MEINRCGDAECGRGIRLQGRLAVASPADAGPDDGIQNTPGAHTGFRRNHAKRICLAGWLESSGQAAVLSKAAVFKPGRFPVLGRSYDPGEHLPGANDARLASRTDNIWVRT